MSRLSKNRRRLLNSLRRLANSKADRKAMVERQVEWVGMHSVIRMDAVLAELQIWAYDAWQHAGDNPIDYQWCLNAMRNAYHFQSALNYAAT